MQLLMSEKELADKLSEARVGGYEFACVVAHGVDPGVAQKMKEHIYDARQADALERLFAMYDKARATKVPA